MADMIRLSHRDGMFTDMPHEIGRHAAEYCSELFCPQPATNAHELDRERRVDGLLSGACA